MDILAVCSSPRKNMTTHSVVKAVLAGAGLAHEVIFPALMEINPCTACMTCKEKTPGRCWQDDDMAGAIEQMLAAKAYIFASPTYYGNMNGPLKNFMDRSIPALYRGIGEEWSGATSEHGAHPFKGRPAVVVAVSGGGGHEMAGASIRFYLEHNECVVVDQFVEGMGGAVVTREGFPDIYDELFGIGKKLAAAAAGAEAK